MRISAKLLNVLPSAPAEMPLLQVTCQNAADAVSFSLPKRYVILIIIFEENLTARTFCSVALLSSYYTKVPLG